MAGLPWKTKTKMKTMLVLIISVCTVSVSYANGRGDPEGIWTADHASHASSASRRAARLLSRKTGLPFPLPPHRAPAAAHSPPVLTPSARPFLSLCTSSSEAIPLSLSLHLSPILFFIPLSHQREGSDQIGCFFLVLVEV